MNAELSAYMMLRADKRIEELTNQEKDATKECNFHVAMDCIKKKCDLYDLKSAIRNLKD